MIFNFGQLVREHSVAILAAFFMTLLVSSPLIAFPFYAGKNYAGINVHHYGSDEHLYLTRAKEVLEGKRLGQPILAAPKDAPDPTFSSIERFLMLPFAVTHTARYVDVPTVYNIYNFIGVFALVLIIYALMLALTGEKFLSIATALFVIGGYSIVYNKTLFYSDFNVYLRSIYPWGASIPFFLYAWCLQRAQGEVRGNRFAILAGVSLGFLFYDYFFAWTFACGFAGSLFLILLAFKQFRYAFRVALAGAIGVFLAIPNLWSFANYFLSDAGKQLAYFLWSSQGHRGVFSLIGAITLLLFVAYWFYRRDENAPFVLAGILAGWIALNQQILTGRFIQYGHYYWYFIVPCSIIFGSYLFTRLLTVRLRMYFSVLLVMLVVLNTTVGQYRSFFTTVGEKMRDQDYAPLIAKLKELPKGSVLMAPDDGSYSYLVTIYTDDDLYFNGGALVFNLSIDYLQDVLLTHLYLNKNARKDPVGFLRAELDAGKIDGYIGVYEDIEGFNSGMDYYAYRGFLEQGMGTTSVVRGALLPKLAARYKELASPQGIRAHLVGSGVRYVLWDTRINPEWDLSVIEPLRALATSTDLVLYEIEERH